MEVLSHFSHTIISIFILLLPLFILFKILKPVHQKLILPPGPQKLPIIGNLHQLTSNKTPIHHRLQELAKVYGPIMHLRLGEVSTVVISSPELAKAVMRTHDANFASRPELMVGKYLYSDSSDIALAPYGEYWRQVRKIATLELFTARRVQSFRAIREEEGNNLIKFIATKAAHGSLVNLSECLFGLIFDLTSRVVFNMKGKDQEAFRVLFTSMSKVLSGFEIADLYPSMKLLQSISGTVKAMKQLVEESNNILDPIIQNHKLNKKQANVKQETLLDVLMKFHKENAMDSYFSLTTNSIKAIILEIFGAGSETSSLTIEWAMSELIKNPNAMKEAQDEVRKIYEGKGMVDETRLDELKFLKMVIKETLRLHPVVPLLVPRQSIEQSQLEGYNIPCKTRVIVNARAIGRDSNYWSEADLFKPERFKESLINYKGNNFEFIPFGAGKRMCPGMALGIASIELTLAMLLYHFDWKLPNEMNHEQLDMEELFALTVRRKNELYVVPILFKDSNIRI